MVKLKKQKCTGPLNPNFVRPKKAKKMKKKVTDISKNISVIRMEEKVNNNWTFTETKPQTTKTPPNICNLFPKKAPKAKIIPINYKVPSETSPEVIPEDIPSEDSDSSVDETLDERKPETPQKKVIGEKTGEYILHPLENSCIIIVHCKSTISFNGMMEVKVLCGAIEILGKILKEGDQREKVYSPNGSAYLTITNKNVRVNCKKTLRKNLIDLGLNEGTVEDIITFKLKNELAIIHCRPFECKMTEFLEENQGQKLYPTKDHLRCKFRKHISSDWNVFRVNPQWDPILEFAKSHENPKLFICGGKGVGKSTLLRFLINKLLDTDTYKDEGVTVVDLDPGQPEFTIPGCVSIVKIKNPLLGPNYTHLKQPVVSKFIPSIKVHDHICYLETVRQLLDCLSVVENHRKGPILVNYMGLNDGIGLNIASSVISMLQPTGLIQIESLNKKARNFIADLWPECVRDHLFEEFQCFDDALDYNFFKVDAMPSNASNSWMLEPRQAREMCILAYFSQLLPVDCSYLTESSVKVYRKKLSALKVIYNGNQVDPMVSNAHLVSLRQKTTSNSILGWGIVRAIDKTSDLIYLLTPVHQDLLNQVDALLIGSVTLPPSIYLRHHEAIKGHIPYTFKGALSNFAKTPKRSIRYPTK